jgi:peptidoglycan/xylan/chitin deacetylase (PgdA/CDA1 family)
MNSRLSFILCFVCATALSYHSLYAQKKISITIDDLPAATTDGSIERWTHITSSVLKALRQHRAPAIGFVNEGKLTLDGKVSRDRERLLRQWHDQGFELGNHTWSHIEYNNHTTAEEEADLLKGEVFIDELYRDVPGRIKYFRHPYLHLGDTQEKKDALAAVLKKHHYTEAPVTIDNSDWIFARAYDIALDKQDTAMQRKLRSDYVPYMISKVNYFESQARALFNRDISHILLMHANTINAACLSDLLSALEATGFAFVTLAEALKDPAYDTPDNFVGRAGISWIHRWVITQQKPKSFFGSEPTTPEYVQKYAGLSE